MRRFLKDSSTGALTLLFTSAVAWAQLSTAQLSGRVTDESGAVLPGVTVTVTQTDTGFTRSRRDRRERSRTCFRTCRPVHTGWRCRSRISAPTSRPASFSRSPPRRSSMRSRRSVRSRKRSPLSKGPRRSSTCRAPVSARWFEARKSWRCRSMGATRSISSTIAGAAVQTGDRDQPEPCRGASAIAVAGGQSFGVAYLLDGAMHNDPQNNLNLPLPFPDALQEFSVATSGLSAQHGMHSGAAVNAVTKSGTNRFSGNLFEFLRHHRFNATNPFALVGPTASGQDDGLRRNQFGGTLGGPIVSEQAVFLWRLSRHHGPSYAGREHRLRGSHGCDAGRRLYGLCLARVQRRPADHA